MLKHTGWWYCAPKTSKSAGLTSLEPVDCLESVTDPLPGLVRCMKKVFLLSHRRASISMTPMRVSKSAMLDRETQLVYVGKSTIETILAKSNPLRLLEQSSQVLM